MYSFLEVIEVINPALPCRAMLSSQPLVIYFVKGEVENNLSSTPMPALSFEERLRLIPFCIGAHHSMASSMPPIMMGGR
jgi:hypothetical protein